MITQKCWSVTPLKSSEVTRGHQQYLADNLTLRRARDMKVVSMRLSRQYVSTDMQLGSRRDLDLRSDFDLDLSRSTCVSFYASWRGEHDAVRILSLSRLVQKLSLKNFTSKNVLVKNVTYLPWPLEANVLPLRHIWWKSVTGACHGLSSAFSRFVVAIIVPEIMADIPDKP